MLVPNEEEWRQDTNNPFAIMIGVYDCYKSSKINSVDLNKACVSVLKFTSF